jgi:tetratricopeptide (TPR) repeat protein
MDLMSLRWIAVAGAALLAATPSLAVDHPAYLHALSDLEDARGHLQPLPTDSADHLLEQEHAVDNINMAIAEINKANIRDGKDIHYHPPVDATLTRTGRFHHALELLEKAKKDASYEEDQANTQGLQGRVLRHIDDAEYSVRHAIEIIEKH